jgi:hypothetical protein
MENEKIPERLIQFQKFANDLMAIQNKLSPYSQGYRGTTRIYSYEETLRIVLQGSLAEKRQLSQNLYAAGTVYTTIIDYYTNLHKWYYFASPTKFENKTLKTVEAVLNFADGLKLPTTFSTILREELINGAYFGMLITDSTTESSYIMSFPYDRIKVIGEYTPGFKAFQVSQNFWKSFKSEEYEIILERMPTEIIQQLASNQAWIDIPSQYAVGFELPASTPPFLMAAAAFVNYLDYAELDKDKIKQALSLLLVQKLPLGKDGDLIFDLEESAVLHELFKMVLGDNKYADAVTTFGDITAVNVNKQETKQENIATPFQQIPLMAGITQSLFTPTTSADALLSVQKDHDLVIGYIERYNNWLDFQVKNFSSTINLRFLPVTSVNLKDYLEQTKNNFAFGFYKMLPPILQGFRQSEIVAQLQFEKSLGIDDLLIPPQDSHTLNAEAKNLNSNSNTTPVIKDDEEKE